MSAEEEQGQWQCIRESENLEGFPGIPLQHQLMICQLSLIQDLQQMKISDSGVSF